MRKFGKPRGRNARVAFELALRNLGLMTSRSPDWRLRARTTSCKFLRCLKDLDIQCGPPNAFTSRGPTRRPRARAARTRASDAPTSRPPTPGTVSKNAMVRPTATGEPFLPRAAHQSTMDHGTQTTAAHRPGWTTVTLVSDSFPCKRKPPLRVTLLVGTTQQRVECRVNLQAGARVSPSGTPPGPYSAYTCPSPGATDWS